MDPKLSLQINRLAARLRDSRYTVAFTGAGISTESGIPDFRGPQGIWKKMQPIELSEFLASPEARREYWRRKMEDWPRMRDAEPNAGHRALARLYELRKLQVVITQNIDGLHQKAGVPDDRVVELHGSNAYVACLDCRRHYEWDEVLPFFQEHPAPECPRCAACGGWLKPATVSFGQAMPPAETRRAFAEAARANVLLAVGSSLQVYPAAAVPAETRRVGGLVAIVNQEATGQDHIADLLLRGTAGSILTELVAQVAAPRAAGEGTDGGGEAP
jgi:NAD-dependent deacetylase